MEYLKSFIARCKAAYPNAQKLHEALDGGHRIAGRYLDDMRPKGVPADLVLNDVTAAKELAQEIAEKDSLYREWSQIDTQNMNDVNAQKEFFEAIGAKATNALKERYGDLPFGEIISDIVSEGWHILRIKGIGRTSFRSIGDALEKYGYIKSASDWTGAGGR
ncbi:MAG: hypothetical protein AB7D37_10995 [Desulfovibrio sp.]